jgi:hypothetical protein
MDRTAHTTLRPDELVGDELQGVNVYGPGEAHIGDVAHFHGVGDMAQVIVDVGGFLGIGAKRVAIPITSLNFTRDVDNSVHATTSMTKDELKSLPEHHD